MKHSREIKVGVLAIVAIFLLYFGFNFLKGVNIFSATNSYYGVYDNLKGLVEQSPVYVRGYKVGQVDKIVYDFTKSSPFVVAFSVNKDIVLPEGTELALISDGLLGGSALQLNIPVGGTKDSYKHNDTLPTIVVPGLVESLESGIIENLQTTLQRIDSLVAKVNVQMEGDHIKATLEHVDKLTGDLQVASADLKVLMHTKVPSVMDKADTVLTDIKIVSGKLSDIDFKATMAKVDSTIEDVDKVVKSVNSKDGTIGLLLNDKDLYINLSNTVESADSLLVDLKKNPKRYVHFSLFGAKDKDKKK